MRAGFLMLVCVVGLGTLEARDKPSTVYAIPLPPRPDFSALQWLVGEWNGSTTGHSPPGQIRLSVEFTLERRFLIFREQLTLAGADSTTPMRESSMGILGGDGSDKGFQLRVFSSTGFVTRYRVTSEAGEIRFTPEGGDRPPPGWLFRRLIQRSGETEFTETVQVAPPHKPFFDYYTAKFSRVTHP